MESREKIVAIIIARGGSKGVPRKNVKKLCGKPLLCWTIDHCKNSKLIEEIWLSSEDFEILDLAKKQDINVIERPDYLSGDEISSEEVLTHAINYISKSHPIKIIVSPQVTSPLRTSDDIDKGIIEFTEGNFDSLFSCSLAQDLFYWEKNEYEELFSVSYDYQARKRRQDISNKYVENGSFYIFKPDVLTNLQNRLGYKIGVSVMESWKSFEIDNEEDFKICSALMNEFHLIN